MLRATSKRIMALPSPGVTTTFDCPVVADPPTPLTLLSSAYEDGTEDYSLSHICSSKTDHAQLRAEDQTQPLPVEPVGAIDTAGSSTPYCAAELNLDDALSGTLDLGRLTQSYQWLEFDTFLVQYQQFAQTTQLPQHSPHRQQPLQYQPQPQQQPSQQFQVQLHLPYQQQQHQQQPQKPYQQRDQLCVDNNPLPAILEGVFVFSSPASLSAGDQQVCALNDNHSFGKSSVDCTMYWDQMAGLSLESSDPCSSMATSSHAEILFGSIEDQMSVSSSPPLLVSDFEIQQDQENQIFDAVSPIEPLSPLPPASPLSRKKRTRAKSAPGMSPYSVCDRPYGAEPSASIFPRVLPACPRRQSESIVLLDEAIGATVAPVPLLPASTVRGAIYVSKRSRASSVGAASCSQCFKWFSRKNNLDMHVKRVHDKERPFLCVWEDCTKTFAARGDLVKHERLHTGEKPFKCKHDGCEVTFTRSEPLDRHHERDHHDCPKGRTCLREA